VGFYTALVSSALFIVGEVGGPFWTFALGFWGMVVGLVLYGSATVRAGILPRWYGWVLVLALPASSVLSLLLRSIVITKSFFWFGLFLLVLSYGLWSQRGSSAQQSSHVR
jgi:hypothetical protein